MHRNIVSIDLTVGELLKQEGSNMLRKTSRPTKSKDGVYTCSQPHQQPPPSCIPLPLHYLHKSVFCMSLKSRHDEL